MSFDLNVGDKMEVRFYCFHDASQQLGVNTVRFAIASATPGGPINSDDMADALDTQYAANFKACLDSSARYAGLSVQDFPLRQMVPSFNNDGAGAGTVAGNDAPTQASGLITLRTKYAGPSGRGRIYVPFPSVTSNDTTGVPTAAYKVLLDSLAGELVGPVSLVVGAGLVDVLVYPIICNAGGTGIEKRVLTASGVLKWATQRRRGSYGRKNSLPAELA